MKPIATALLSLSFGVLALIAVPAQPHAHAASIPGVPAHVHPAVTGASSAPNINGLGKKVWDFAKTLLIALIIIGFSVALISLAYNWILHIFGEHGATGKIVRVIVGAVGLSLTLTIVLVLAQLAGVKLPK